MSVLKLNVAYIICTDSAPEWLATKILTIIYKYKGVFVNEDSTRGIEGEENLITVPLRTSIN